MRISVGKREKCDVNVTADIISNFMLPLIGDFSHWRQVPSVADEHALDCCFSTLLPYSDARWAYRMCPVATETKNKAK